MYKKLATMMAAGAITLGVGLSAGPVSAAPTTTVPRDLTAEKARCTTMIDVRLAELTKLDSALAAATRVTPAHRTAQTSSNTAAASGLGALKTKIAADTDRATLSDDCKTVVDGYRVFALRAPQTHLVIAGDTETAAIAALNQAVPKLSTAIDQAGAAGKDVTAAKAALADLRAKLADATGKVGGLGDAVIVMTPVQYNANHGLLDGSRGSVKAGAADLKAARADIKTITSTVKA